MSGYANGNVLQDVGVLSGGDMTPEAALAKLHYLLSKDLSTDEMKQKLISNIKGELTI